MSALTPVRFPDLVRRMRREVEVCRSIFDLPVAKWFHPGGKLDVSARHFSGRASTPVGPAAGPHTQMAQNLVLSWLAGGRILELKTVQVNDHLNIPRPCIHIPNVGYNVEWSQELTVAESLREYAKSVYLIEILKKTAGFGVFDDVPDFARTANTIYDASIGYDYEGIRSEKVTGFLRGLKNPESVFQELRCELEGDLVEFGGIKLPAFIANCVTLSTFHGCPANQIEDMARYLHEEMGMHVVVKLNPTLLGFERVRQLLTDRLGYHHLVLIREAFERDLQYDHALEMLRRLRAVAGNCGLEAGAKFTNTLVVGNNPSIFPTQADPYMYLSGQPLHVVAMTLMQQVREDMGFDLGVSFSAGIDRRNFAATVACGMVPVTTCTDLLRQGGYGRLPGYLNHLAGEMRRMRVSSLEAYVLAAGGHMAEAVSEALQAASDTVEVWKRKRQHLTEIASQRPDEMPSALREVVTAAGLDAEAVVLRALRAAGRLNGRDIVPGLAEDPRYHAQSNRSEPHRVTRALDLYDCINCDLCITACPNDAIFPYAARPVEATTEVLGLRREGNLTRAPGSGFAIRRTHQLAVVQDLCNECSNCDEYCPEHGAPYKVKERVFLHLESFRGHPTLDGFCRQDGALLARLHGRETQLEPDAERNRAMVRGECFEVELQWEPLEVKRAWLSDSSFMMLDTALFWRMKTAWECIFHSARPNMVNPDPVSAGSRRPGVAQ